MQSTVKSIYDELTKRGVQVTAAELGSAGGTLLMFRRNGKLRTMTGSAPDLTRATARTICNDKSATHFIANELGIRTPQTSHDLDNAEAFLREHGTIVVKPTNGAHGFGITTGITTTDQLQAAITKAKSLFDGGALLQQQVSGSDYRVLIIGGKLAACAERVPANITGDGVSTIRQLIIHENTTNDLRGSNYEKPLSVIDELTAEQYLGEVMNTIPKSGENVTVVGTANIGTGGEAIDRTATLPDDMVKTAERIASEIGAFVCGVDFMYDPSTKEWYLIELNSSPSFGLHVSPSVGESIDLPELFVNRLFAEYDA